MSKTEIYKMREHIISMQRYVAQFESDKSPAVEELRNNLFRTRQSLDNLWVSTTPRS